MQLPLENVINGKRFLYVDFPEGYAIKFNGIIEKDDLVYIPSHNRFATYHEIAKIEVTSYVHNYHLVLTPIK